MMKDLPTPQVLEWGAQQIVSQFFQALSAEGDRFQLQTFALIVETVLELPDLLKHVMSGIR